MSSECGDPGSRDTTTSCLLLFGLGVVLVVGTSDEGGSCFWTGGKRLAPKVAGQADKGKELPSRLGLVPYLVRLLRLLRLLVHSLASVKNTQVTQLGRHASYVLIALYCLSGLVTG
jgi:hypothetical protein